MFAGAKLWLWSRRIGRHRHHTLCAFLRLTAFGIALTAALPAKAGPFDAAVERYRPCLIADIDAALAGARDMRARLTAKDVVGARKAWIDARVGPVRDAEVGRRRWICSRTRCRRSREPGCLAAPRHGCQAARHASEGTLVPRHAA